MSRLKADLLLFLVAIIWGTAFVAQKDGMNSIGPLTFVAARFALSTLLIAPFAWRERRRSSVGQLPRYQFVLVLLFFVGGVISQQLGLKATTVTNAGFLTGIYVLFVPITCLFFFKEKISGMIWPAAVLSVIGVWFLSGSTGPDFSALNNGDLLILLCAVFFGVEVALLGHLLRQSKSPLQICVIQYGITTLVAGIGAFYTETVSLEAIKSAGFSIFYAGAISGGIAYTLQAIAQQYTPSSDTAVIVSLESVFAAIAAAYFLDEQLTDRSWIGCAIILFAVLIVEVGPYLTRAIKPSNV